MTWRVNITGIPPTPNRSRREFWAHNASVAARWRKAAKEAADETIDEMGYVPHIERANVTITVVPKTHIRRDPDNAVAACKPILDGIVDAGILRDDSFDVIERLTVCRWTSPTGPRIVVEIEERA